MLVELGLVEQRYQAGLEVLNDGATVTDVARRYGVARQTVHVWLTTYTDQGLRGTTVRSSAAPSIPSSSSPRATVLRTRATLRPGPGAGYFESSAAAGPACRSNGLVKAALTESRSAAITENVGVDTQNNFGCRPSVAYPGG